MITVDMVEKVYSGRSGCACGCRGNYRDTKQAINMMVKRFNRYIAAGLPDVDYDSSYTAIDMNGRLNTIYYKSGVIGPKRPEPQPEPVSK